MKLNTGKKMYVGDKNNLSYPVDNTQMTEEQ